MKIGTINTAYSYLGEAEGAKIAKTHGFDGFDYQYFVNTEKDYFKLNADAFEKKTLEYKNIYESEGITVHQTHGPWRVPQDATPEDRAERFEAMSKAIYGTAVLGSKNFIIHPLMPYGWDSPEDPEGMTAINIEFFGRLRDVAETYGITICYENMPFPNLPIASVKQILDIVAQVNRDNFKVCLDTGHCAVLGDDAGEMVRMIGKDRLYALHVHDNDGNRDLHWLPHTGVIDWSSFKKALIDINYTGVLSLETAINRKELSKTEWETKEIELANIAKKLAGII
jgi:sugar phosphate isomerase/epimerase